MPVMEKVLSRFGLARKNGEVPIINDGRGNLPSVRIVQGFGLGTAQWTTRDYGQMAEQGYTQNSDVYACVSLIAGTAKAVRWDESGKGAESAKLYADSGGSELMEQWISYLLLSGNDYLEIDRFGGETDTSGPIRRVYLLGRDRVRANVAKSASKTDEATLVESWAVTAYNQRRAAVPVQNIVHSKLFNPTDDIYGMAPLAAAMLRVDAENEGLALMKRVLQRGFSPGWIQAREDSEWADTQVNQLR